MCALRGGQRNMSQTERAPRAGGACALRRRLRGGQARRGYAAFGGGGGVEGWGGGGGGGEGWRGGPTRAAPAAARRQFRGKRVAQGHLQATRQPRQEGKGKGGGKGKGSKGKKTSRCKSPEITIPFPIARPRGYFARRYRAIHNVTRCERAEKRRGNERNRGDVTQRGVPSGLISRFALFQANPRPRPTTEVTLLSARCDSTRHSVGSAGVVKRGEC